MPTASDDSTAGPAVATPDPYPAWDYSAWQRQRARVVIKADLLPSVMILSMISLLGMGVGWLWSRLAPPQRMIVLQDRHVVLPLESYHRYDALAVFTALGLAAGVVTGVGVWFLRERRGPVVMIAAVIGAVVAAWLAKQMGLSWAAGHYPVPAALTDRMQFDKAPELESGWGILAWPLTTALAYGVLAAWNGMEDLGRRLN